MERERWREREREKKMCRERGIGGGKRWRDR
jgi:hypothetical protein